MKNRIYLWLILAAGSASAAPFSGKIDIVITQGSETTPLLYTVGENFIRIEVTSRERPNPIDIVDLKTGALALLFPHNRSFVRLKPAGGKEAVQLPNVPAFPTPPPGVGPQLTAEGLPGTPPIPPRPSSMQLPPGIGPQSAGSGIPSGPMMAMLPPQLSEKIELKPTGKKETILGFDCEQFELKQRGETLELFATDQLLPYQPYVRNQRPRFGPRMIEEEWAEVLRDRKLFPLQVSLHYDNGPERLHFEVKAVKKEKVTDTDGKLFQPPEGYVEVQPLPN